MYHCLETDSWSRSSLRLCAAEQLSQAMLEHSRHGRSIVLYSRDFVSRLTHTANLYWTYRAELTTGNDHGFRVNQK